MVGMGKGAENGILIKSGESLEVMHNVTTVVLDKTGTITEGKPSVTDIIAIDIDEIEVLSLVASAESKSEHPLAKAIMEEVSNRNIKFDEADNFENIAGGGVKARSCV